MQNIRHGLKALPLAAAMVGAMALAACQGDSTNPTTGVLAGVAHVTSNDTTIGTPPVGTTTPGSFHGFVIGHGTGVDTMLTAPRIVGATVTAYPQLGFDGSTPLIGDPVGTVTTDASGTFQFPEIAGGNYVVVVRPPASSGYRSVYILATISNVSNSGNWWVVLSQE
jgi:hypothetical protein